MPVAGGMPIFSCVFCCGCPIGGGMPVAGGIPAFIGGGMPAFIGGGMPAFIGGGMPAFIGGGMPAFIGGGMPAFIGGGMPAFIGGGMPAFIGGGMPAFIGGGMPAFIGGGMPLLAMICSATTQRTAGRTARATMAVSDVGAGWQHCPRGRARGLLRRTRQQETLPGAGVSRGGREARAVPPPLTSAATPG